MKKICAGGDTPAQTICKLFYFVKAECDVVAVRLTQRQSEEPELSGLISSDSSAARLVSSRAASTRV
jgi:hypothetical protein